MPARRSRTGALVVGLLVVLSIWLVRTSDLFDASWNRPGVGPAEGIVRLAAELERRSVEGTHAAVARRPVELSGRLRDAIVVESQGELFLEGAFLAGGHVRVSIAAEPLSAPSRGQTTVTFRVLLRGPEGSRSLLREELKVSPREKPSWSDHRFELPESSPGTELVFSVAFEGPAVRAFWGAPLLFRDAPATRPDVILVSIDTLGAKHMSCYGYERETTPNLDRFARGSLLFEQAVSHQSWTLTAHMSLLTSLYPDTHKVSLGTSLAAGLPLLPGLLREAGYFTAGRVSNVYLSPKYGYDRAYDYYALLGRQSVEDAAQEVGRLLESPVPHPFFLFLHLIDPHSDWRRLPYDSPKRFRPQPPEDGWESVRTCFEDRCATRYLALVNEGHVTLGADVEAFRSLYDAGVRYTDHHLGLLFDELQGRGLFENALVIITSDHGEEFLEHGKVMHTQGYDECLRVPLIFKFPGGLHAGQRIPQQVQHVDVMPTVLDVLGLDPPRHLEGRSLLPLIDGEAPVERIAFSKGLNQSMTPRDCYVARTDDWKLLWWLEDDRTELYDLRADPGEARDLTLERPEVHDQLLDALRKHRQLRNTGFHLRVPPHVESGTLTVVVTTTGRFRGVTEVNSNPPERGPECALAVRAGEVSFTLIPRSQDAWKRAVGFDFDVEPSDSPLQLSIQVDDRPLPATSLFLGAAGDHPPRLPLTIPADRAGAGDDSRPPLPAASTAPQVYFWESRPNLSSVHLTAGERSTLEALGYMGGED